MESHASILRRVGIVMLVYFGIRTFGLAFDFATGVSHSFTVDLLTLILGILLVTGSLGAARWVAFLTAFELAGCAIGVVVCSTWPSRSGCCASCVIRSSRRRWRKR